MRVLQINMCYETGSTGRTTKELEMFLENNKISSFVIYGFGKMPNKKNHYRIVNKTGYYLHNLAASLSSKQGYFSYLQTKKMIKWIDNVKPDIIHLRNLHGNCINLPLLFDYLKNHDEIDVILTTHDFWLITGWCTTLLCDKWKNEGCGPCPMFKRNKHNWLFDRSKSVFSDRKKMLLSLPNLHIQCVSNFCKSIIDQSFLHNADCFVVYNWINTDVFYPRERKITPKKPLILVVWSIVNDNSQRFKDFYRVATMMINECDFLIVGKPIFDVGKYKNVTFMNSISDLDELAHAYSSADVFFDPSTDDTFGKVVAEALACGTRVVVYNSKALPELVGPGCGEIVEPGDYDSCCEAIRRCILAGKNKDNYCREWILKKFSYENNCNMLLNKYYEIKKERENEN